ncbi:glycoside hydrolase superfamily [Phakopsora pachyrhizi]|uniref:glucan endo-1,3-beta-D-glucosidase n=1 Tax=Phakopsora pachyrhizi TaxID=170000 RepID=A0A0S1MIZ4_PHAPC|nr:glycoside hydrolase superfamily [Phakopsora pachyrhizi]CAH7668014.1 glycoside hydrolase superfamily [Phakopsora pachyrhizi]
MRLSYALEAFASLTLLGILVRAQTPSFTRSFYGMAYSPEGAILPNCGASQANVTRDMALLAQMTPRLRLYGSDCNQTELVLQGIKDAGNVDLSIWLGIYIDGNDTVYQRQLDAVTTAIKKYGTEHIAGITVGNEFLLLSFGEGGTAADPKGIAARATLLNYVQKTNSTIQAMKLDKPIPLGTSDAGSAVTKELCAGVDYVMANVHPWFGSVPIEQAAVWTWQFFQDFDVKICAQAPNNPIMYIAETGWPTASDEASKAVNGASSPASSQNLQRFMDDFVCQANANQTNYFFFEYKDEIWKKIYGGVEPHWGLYDQDMKFKDLKTPNCPVTSPTGRSVAPLSKSAISGAPGGSGGVSVASDGAKTGSSSPSLTSINRSSFMLLLFNISLAFSALLLVL